MVNELTLPETLRLGEAMAQRLGITVAQARMLCATYCLGVMDHEISSQLELYPRSKVRARVLDPLNQEGWLVFHSYPPEAGTGANRHAWSIRQSRGGRLRRHLDLASQEYQHQIKAAEIMAKHLKDTVLGL